MIRVKRRSEMTDRVHDSLSFQRCDEYSAYRNNYTRFGLAMFQMFENTVVSFYPHSRRRSFEDVKSTTSYDAMLISEKFFIILVQKN